MHPGNKNSKWAYRTLDGIHKHPAVETPYLCCAVFQALRRDTGDADTLRLLAAEFVHLASHENGAWREFTEQSNQSFALMVGSALAPDSVAAVMRRHGQQFSCRGNEHNTVKLLKEILSIKDTQQPVRAHHTHKRTAAAEHQARKTSKTIAGRGRLQLQDTTSSAGIWNLDSMQQQLGTKITWESFSDVGESLTLADVASAREHLRWPRSLELVDYALGVSKRTDPESSWTKAPRRCGEDLCHARGLR